MTPSEPGNLQVAARKRKLRTCDRSHRSARCVDPRTLPIACTKNGSHALRARAVATICNSAGERNPHNASAVSESCRSTP